MTKTKSIQDQTFLFTGTLTEFTREEAEALVETNGGKVLSGVSAKLNYLVVGADAGSKLDKAKALGTVKILTEKQFLKLVPKENSSLKSSNADETMQEFVFACNSSTDLCKCHGMEIAIGKLSKNDLEEIAKLVEDEMYLNSDYFSNWHQFDDVYHENGVFLDGSNVDDLEDKNNLSTSNFYIGNVKLNDIVLDKKSTYLCTFRNETIYNVSKAVVNGKVKNKLDCEVSTFSFLGKLANINVSILKSASVNGENLERNSADEEDSGEIYDTNQFLIKDGKIVFYASNGDGQYPFILNNEVPQLNSDLNKETLKKLISNIAVRKKSNNISASKSEVEKTAAIKKVKKSGFELNKLDSIFKDDEDVVLTAIINEIMTYQYASDRLRDDDKFFEKAVKATNSGELIAYASDRIKNDKKCATIAIKSKWIAYNELGDDLKTDEDLLRLALDNNDNVFSNTSPLATCDSKFHSNKGIVKNAIKNWGYAIMYASDDLKNDRELVLMAVSKIGGALEYASDKLKDDKEIVFKAISNDVDAIQYASKKLQKDEAVQKASQG